ncbi:MAG: MBL fold metallo-hydrolase [Hyphomonadaceae bacterium]|nr:MBL fold metallo-hydrolase [Hyphomonadaceae bacterium]
MSDFVRITILGCGSSGGVPRINGDWGACDPNEPRNMRSRCGLLVQGWKGEGRDEAAATNVLIDTSPDLRMQVLRAGIKHVDAVIFTHDHADQVHGIDDLRAFALAMQRKAPVHMDAPTRATLMARFGYCFQPTRFYPPILEDASEIVPFRPLTITGEGGDIAFLPLPQDHGGRPSLGFRMGPVGYCNDLVALPEESFAALEGVDTFIVDALRYTPHPTHAHLALALEWIARLRPRRSILTNLHIDLDYRRLSEELPPGVEPAFDGMTVEIG